MLFLLSPAKTLDYDTPLPAGLPPSDAPAFRDRSAELIELLRSKGADEIGALMDISPALSELNVQRYADWSTRFTAKNSRPAVLAFAGDVYDGLDARTLDGEDLRWAQQHLAILSGLYGLLRPMDKLQPYRLEMGTALANPRGKDLYAFWGDTLAQALNQRLRGEKAPVVVNLASQEYFKAVDRQALKARVVECVFEEGKGDRYKIVSFFAKKARGTMARWAIRERLEHPEALPRFVEDGYAYAAEVSAPDRLVFRRRSSTAS